MARKCYITQDELVDMIKSGQEVQVFDAKSGEDITALVLTQLILEHQKNGPRCLFSTEVLHQLIQYRDDTILEFFHGYLPQILQSYLVWQQEAQNQFLHWAKLGWSASQVSQDFLMPGLNLRRRTSAPYSEATPDVAESPGPGSATLAEIETLKQKVADLESRLKKSRKQG